MDFFRSKINSEINNLWRTARVSSVIIVTRLRDGIPGNRSSIAARDRGIPLVSSVQSGSAVHVTQWDTRGFIPGGNAAGAWSWLPAFMPRLQWVELYLQCPIRLHGTVLNEAQGQFYQIYLFHIFRRIGMKTSYGSENSCCSLTDYYTMSFGRRLPATECENSNNFASKRGRILRTHLW
jgi:hypothetical protein